MHVSMHKCKPVKHYGFVDDKNMAHWTIRTITSTGIQILYGQRASYNVSHWVIEITYISENIEQQ